MFKIQMTQISNDEGYVLYDNIPTFKDACAITETMNRLNEETAKFTGKAIRFVYSVIVK